MSSRHLVTLLLAALLAPATAHAQANEWEEDYSDTWADEDEGQGQEPLDVQAEVDEAPTASLETFQGGLQPYGSWVASSRYGRTWRPHVAAGWRPYYYGRWEWTNEGWLWVSDEPFGWAVYHYGRWAWDDPWGWVWVPGYQWAPAWVSWRTSGDVIGWAPLSPGLSLYVSAYPFVDFWWTFVPTYQFVSYPVYRCAYAPSYTRQHFYRTAPAPARPAPRPGMARAAPRPAWGGPSPRAIEERVGRAVRPVRVVQAPSPGAVSRPGEVAIYRPGRPVARGGGSVQERAVDRRVPGIRPAPVRSDYRGSPRPQGRGDEVRPAERSAPPARREAAPSSGWRPRPEQRTSERRADVQPQERRAEPRSQGGESRRSEGNSRPAPAPSRGDGGGRGERRERR